VAISAVLLTFLRIAVQKGALKWAEQLGIKQKKKYSESVWKFSFYLFIWLWELYEVYVSDFFPETRNCWRGYPNMPPLTPSFKYLYILQLGFYTHSVYAHFTMETKRGDYWVLFAHHLVTLFLLYWSYMIGFARVGLLVLVCHDTNDVFLELGKTFVYRDQKRMINISFVFVIISWIITRLGLFPFVVMKSSIFELLEVIPWDVAGYCWYLHFNIALSFLLCLHVYWFYLMLRMAHRMLTTGQDKVVDIREDKTATSDGHSPLKKS